MIVVGTDAATVADAIALAVSGDTIVIPSGTWAECIDTAGKSLTISGEGATLDGSGLCDNVVRVAGGETVSIEGLTVVNSTGRAFDLEWSTVELDDVTVSGAGRADWSGGAVWVDGATLTTSSCVFTDNVAAEGAAVYLYSYATWIDTGSTFRGNKVPGSGGAVMAYYDNTLALTGGTFEENTAGYYGGAVATWDYTDLAVTESTFTDNAAPGTGGGAIFYYPVDSAAGVLSVASSTFTANTSSDGGAIWAGWVNDATVGTSTFSANTATNTGGAVLAYVTNTTRLTHDTFCGNSATTGGAVSVQWTGVDSWAYDTFVENGAVDGGAAHRYAAYAGTITQSTFAGNGATDWGGAYDASWAYADFRNNVVVDSEGAGLYTAEAGTYANSPLAYDGWSGNTIADAAGYFVVSDTDGHVIADDPGFVAWSADGDCTNDDLRLRGDSPFKDAGDPALLDLDGSRSDPGAWGGLDQLAEDRDGDGADTTTDCDDTDPDHFPGAAERCNGADDDCDGTVDEPDAADASAWYTDADGDGFGDPTAIQSGCTQPAGTVTDATDCDDTNPWVNPDASDYPADGTDADCDGADNTQVRPAAGETDEGCGCQSGGTRTSFGLLLLVAALVRRRSFPSP
jgi:MYXO-CTERM domain-containing protein